MAGLESLWFTPTKRPCRREHSALRSPSKYGSSSKPPTPRHARRFRRIPLVRPAKIRAHHFRRDRPFIVQAVAASGLVIAKRAISPLRINHRFSAQA